jgi:DNA-binding PadR family transcriptional regulator
VYTTLTRLERDGLIEAADDGDESQRVYAITTAGRAEVRDWFASSPTWLRLTKASETRSTPCRAG